jgi:asparagine synthase (glutamine-hydrolysing)
VELEQRGHRFRTRTDTETVLAAFLEWDTDCFSRLRGMFAIALWTESRKRLVLARDRMGIKPLYIARHGADLFFGSELKTIFVHPEFDRRLSLGGLDCYLVAELRAGPWTLVEGIEKLRPGYWLEWAIGEVRSEAYWSLPLGPPRDWSQGSRRGGTGFAAAAIGERTSALGCAAGRLAERRHRFLTVLHYAATASSNRLKTFSISFRGRSFDETANIFARRPRSTAPITRKIRRQPGGGWRTPSRNSRITSMNRTRTPARCRSGISPR